MSLLSGGFSTSGTPVRVYFLLTAGLIMFAFAPILVRVAGDTDPFVFAAIRTMSAALILLPVWMITGLSKSREYDRKDNLVALLAGSMLGLHFIFWILAVQNTTIASASVLVTIHPIILILIEAGVLKRTFPGMVWSGVMIAFFGSAFLGYSDFRSETAFEHALLGDFYAFIAAILFALYFLISQQLRQKSDWINYIMRVYGATGLTCLIVALWLGKSFPHNPVVWLAAIGLAIGPQIIGHGSMNYSVKYISPVVLSMLVLTEPVFATILAWVLFTEVPPILTFPAMLIIMAGITMAWTAKKGIAK
ncbi:DMT family transporter [Balneolaceae bacterium ANBcel3]|nr:DMT family transporter [Balneolaceae bacterium ANBcel3]